MKTEKQRKPGRPKKPAAAREKWAALNVRQTTRDRAGLLADARGMSTDEIVTAALDALEGAPA